MYTEICTPFNKLREQGKKWKEPCGTAMQEHKMGCMQVLKRNTENIMYMNFNSLK